MKITTHYDNLQVARNASPEVIRAAYRGLTQRCHPDRHPENRARYERVMKIINEAFAVLSDPRKRGEHDAWIAQQEAAANAEPTAQANPASGPHPRDVHSPTHVPPAHARATANCEDAASTFRRSRVTPTALEPARSEPQRAPAGKSPRLRPTGKKGQLVTWQDWVTGVFAVGCVLAAWPTWNIAGPTALIVGLGLLGWLAVRGLKQQAAIDAGRNGAGAQAQLAIDEQTSPMSAWTGIGIAALVVIAIMAAIPLSASRAGRVAIVMGGATLVLLVIRLIARRVERARSAGASPSEAFGVACWLTAMVWGWLAYALTPHRPGAVAWPDYVVLEAVLLAAWIPAYGACRALLLPGTQRNLSWMQVSGYIFPVSLTMVVLMMLRDSTGESSSLLAAQPASTNDSALSLTIAHYVGASFGVLISAALATVILVGVGALASWVIARIYAVVNAPQPHARVATLLVSWAAIPTFGMVVFLIKWVP